MRKFCNGTVMVCCLLAAALFMTAAPRQVQARQPYYMWWLETYPDVAKKNDVKTAVKCNVCHVGTSKTKRNDYGKAIAKALSPKKNLKKTPENKDIFADALKTVEQQKSGTEGKTFGDLLQAGELPAASK